MLMVQQKRPWDHAKSRRNRETGADVGRYSALIRSLMRYNRTHDPKVDPVATLVRDSEGRWKLVAPCFWPVQIDHKYLGTEAQLDMVDSLPISLPVILFPANQDMEQMIHHIKTNLDIDNSITGPKSRQYRSRSKRSKCLKDFSNVSVDNRVLPNELPDFPRGDLSSSNAETLHGGEDKINKTIKTSSKKKGKRKSRHHKKSLLGKDPISNDAVCERNVHSISASSASGVSEQSKSFMDLSGSYSPESTVTSDLSLQLTRRRTHAKEKSVEHLDNLCMPVVYALKSDLMDESGQSLNATQTGEFVLSPFENNTTNCDFSKTSSTCDASYFSSLDKSPLSDFVLEEWPSDSTSLRHINDKNMPDILDDRGLPSAECQTVSDSFNKNCTLGNTISDQCDRNVEANGVRAKSLIYQKKIPNGVSSVFEESVFLNDNESCENDSICQSCIPGKRGRHAREPSGNPHSSHKFSSRNTYPKMQKGVAVAPIWKRVQKKGVDGCHQRPQIPNLASEPDTLKEHEIRTRSGALLSYQLSENESVSIHSNCDEVPSRPETCLSDNRVIESNRLDCDSKSEKMVHVNKKMNNPGSMSKENAIESYTKGPGKGKPVTIWLPNTPMQEHTAVNKSSVIRYRGRQNLRSLDKTNYSKIVSSQTYRITSVTLNSKEGTQTHSNQTSPPHNVQCSIRENVHAVHDQFSPSCSILNSLEKICDLELQPSNANGILDATDMISETTAFDIESCSLDHFSGMKQKWVPVGKKEAKVATHLCDLILYKEHLKRIEKDMFPKSSTCPSGYSSSILKSAESAAKDNDMENRLIERPGQMSGESNGEYSAVVDNSCSEEKILQAVMDAFGVQTASEVIYLQTGCHLAEFEKVLHSASPVISQMPSLPGCSFCSHGRITGNSLCRHQIPNISLGKLWQWYAKHGSYGLEVKVEDQCTSKMGSNSEFRAYFVPYLSAVQLFGLSKFSEFVDYSNSCETHNVSSETDSMGDSFEAKRSSKCGSRLTLPLLSILLPWPHQSMPVEVLENPPQSTKADHECNVAADRAQDAGRLLFEYFESDPPQQRPPLFEKIKMLVRGERSLNSRIFGDPSKLECLHLHDIGPASWFSVAWYPIYRIPDGNLRAAFLTYHCLGNFAYRSSEAKHCNAANIVSPAVGLQSYNSKGECWFLPGDSKANSFQTGAPLLNPSEVLKERLRTLNQTAEMMARASIEKFGHKSINRQPDYEFFTSRAW